MPASPAHREGDTCTKSRDHWRRSAAEPAGAEPRSETAGCDAAQPDRSASRTFLQFLRGCRIHAEHDQRQLGCMGSSATLPSDGINRASLRARHRGSLFRPKVLIREHRFLVRRAATGRPGPWSLADPLRSGTPSLSPYGCGTTAAPPSSGHPFRTARRSEPRSRG